MKIAFYSMIGVVVVIVGVWTVSRKLKVSVETKTPQVSAVVSASPTPSPAASVTPIAKVTTSPTVSPTATPTPSAAAGTFTAAQVATHNSQSSCYSIISGSVYDLTSYIPKHPGGTRQILEICGTDGTSLFSDQHGGQSKPANILASYKIGVLAN